MGERHVHADVMHEWLEGADVQFWDAYDNKWKDVKEPLWSPKNKYRVKPNEWCEQIPKQGVICWAWNAACQFHEAQR